MSLETAPPEVKLAVDLIELLETNELPPELVLAALAIVKNDYERKLAEGKDHGSLPVLFSPYLSDVSFSPEKFFPT